MDSSGPNLHGCNDNGGVNWKRLRGELAACRVAAGLNQTQLAHRIGIAKSTVNRIENVYGEPDHVPDLDTIERWVIETSLTLASFFARIEALPDIAEVAEDQSTPTLHKSAADEAVPTLSRDEIATIRALTKVLRQDADREHAESLRGPHSRHAPGLSRQETPPSPKAGKHRQRNAKRRLKSDRHKR